MKMVELMRCKIIVVNASQKIRLSLIHIFGTTKESMLYALECFEKYGSF